MEHTMKNSLLHWVVGNHKQNLPMHWFSIVIALGLDVKLVSLRNRISKKGS